MRVREGAREIGETGSLALTCGGVARMQHHAGSEGSGGVLPVPFLGTVFAGADDHVGHVLGVGHIPLGEDADLGQRVETRSVSGFDRRKLEAHLPGLVAESRGLGPVLALDVVDHAAIRPDEQRGQHQAHAFAGARGSERQDMRGAVVPQIMQPVLGFVEPSADVDALTGPHQTRAFDVSGGGPTRRAVKVLGVL